MQGPIYQIRDSSLWFKTVEELYTGFITLVVYNMVNITLFKSFLSLFFKSFFIFFITLIVYNMVNIILVVYNIVNGLEGAKDGCREVRKKGFARLKKRNEDSVNMLLISLTL